MAFFSNMIKNGKGYMFSKMSDSDYDELKLERQYVSHKNNSKKAGKMVTNITKWENDMTKNAVGLLVFHEPIIQFGLTCKLII